MLSVYSILRPPKTGNCKILDSNENKITISDLKDSFNNDIESERMKKINSLKSKLDTFVIHNVEIDDVFESNIHNYNKVEATECVVYYLCGYLARYFAKRITCEVCKTPVIGMMHKLMIN